MTTAPQSDIAGAQSYPPPNQARYMLAVLFVAYICSFVDRAILTLMVQPIRASLHISDVQISLLHGLAFALFFTILGLPIARLADRSRRVSVIAVGVFVWSGMTALCGLAQNFTQMFLARMGVGVGEAALAPSAFSILADCFSKEKLPQALSLFGAAPYVGAGLAMMGGGAAIAYVQPMTLPWIGYVEPWRLVFFVVGLPGLLVVLLMMTVREPRRLGLSDRFAAGDHASLNEAALHVKARRLAYGSLLLSVIFQGMMWNGVIAWMPTFFIRNFGLSPAVVGLWCGLALIVAASAGIICGGAVVGWLKRRGHTDGNHIVLFGAAILTAPLALVMTLSPSPQVCFVLYGLFLFVSSSPYGAASSAFQELTPNQMRAQISAIYQFCLNLAGIGLGPTVVALLTERVFADEMALKWSIPLMAAITLPLGALTIAWGRRAYRTAVEAGY